MHEAGRGKKASTSVLGVQEKWKFRQANIYANVLPLALGPLDGFRFHFASRE